MKSEVSEFCGKGEEGEKYLFVSEESETDDEGWELNDWLPQNYFSRFFDSIRCDRKDRFVKLWNIIRREETVLELNNDPLLKFCKNPLHPIFNFDAANCWEAVLNGAIPGLLEINDVNEIPFTNYNAQLVPILHKAARYGAPRIANLCLPGNESQLNLRIDVDGMEGVLPLNLALQNLVLHIECREFHPPHNKMPASMLREVAPHWIFNQEEPQRLVYKFIFHLCARSGKSPAAEIVRMLAQRTAEIEQEFFKYVKERKIPELTILLLLAHDILTPHIEGGSEIRDFVSEEIAALKIFILRSTYEPDSSNLIYEASKQKLEMEAIMMVLEIFSRVGNKIAAYLELRNYREYSKELDRVSEVSSLLKEAGFDAELDLLDEIIRKETDIFDIMEDTPKNNKDEESNIGLLNNALGKPNQNQGSHMRIYNTEFKQSSMHWLANKQDMVTKLNNQVRNRASFTNHFARGQRGFGSTTVNKVGSFNRTFHYACANGGLGSTTADKFNGMVSKFQVKKNYQDSHKSSAGRITGVYSWASYLRFYKECVFSANSSCWVLWISSKLGRAL